MVMNFNSLTIDGVSSKYPGCGHLNEVAAEMTVNEQTKIVIYLDEKRIYFSFMGHIQLNNN